MGGVLRSLYPILILFVKELVTFSSSMMEVFMMQCQTLASRLCVHLILMELASLIRRARLASSMSPNFCTRSSDMSRIIAPVSGVGSTGLGLIDSTSTVLIGDWFDGYWFEPTGSTAIGSMGELFQVEFLTLALNLRVKQITLTLYPMLLNIYSALDGYH